MDEANPYNEDPDFFVRSARHPSAFWVVIGLKVAGAALLIGAALGDLLGLWKR